MIGIIKKIFWTITAIAAGAFAVFFVFNGGQTIYTYINDHNDFKCVGGSCLTAQLTKDSAEQAEQLNLAQVSATAAKKLKLNATAYLVADIDTGETILSKDIDKRYPIASVSKLITALVASEMIKEKIIIDNTVKKTWEIYGRPKNVKETDPIKITDLLYPLLLQSSNKVAEILATEAGWPNFIRQMNEKSLMMGMNDSLFEEPSGLSANNISTANDLLKLAKYLHRNQKNILNITLQGTKQTLGLTWYNNSRFLSGYNYLGGKTGFTNAAKQTLLSIFEVPINTWVTEKPGEKSKKIVQKRRIAIIILQSNNRLNDVRTILEFLKKNPFPEKSKIIASPETQTASVLNYNEPIIDSAINLEKPTAEIIPIITASENSPVYPIKTLIVTDNPPPKKEYKENIAKDDEYVSENIKPEQCPLATKQVNDMLLYNVNKANSLENYVPENLVEITENTTSGVTSFCLTLEVADAVKKMFDAAKKDNLNLLISSSFRNKDRQQILFDDKNQTNYKYLLIAEPGHSEHQLGTTVDLTGQSINYQKATFSFDQTPEYVWLKQNAYKFGFVESYPKGKESITGFQYEPWHWRYIGRENAEMVVGSDITLSEFINKNESNKLTLGSTKSLAKAISLSSAQVINAFPTTNTIAGSVSAMDSGNQGQIVKKIYKISKTPAAKSIAFSPDGSEIWTTLLLNETRGVSIYNSQTGDKITDINLNNGGGVEIIFSKDGSKAYISQMETASVFEIDTATKKIIRQFFTKANWTKGLGLSPDETRLYASNWMSNNISEFDLASGNLIRNIPAVKTPRGFYITEDAKFLYTTSFDDGEIRKIDLSNGDQKTIFRNGGALRHIAADPEKKVLYISDMRKWRILKLSLIDDTISEFAVTEAMPNTIALSPDRKILFVSNRGRNNPKSYYQPGPEWGSVLLFDTETGRKLDAIVGGNQPTALDVSKDGSILAFSNFLDNNIEVWSVPSYDELLAGGGGFSNFYKDYLKK